MLGSVAYRGSLSRKSALMTAGNLTLTVSKPPSTSRFTSTLPSDTVTSDANVACGQPNRAAVIWAVWLESSSIACLPTTTISTFSSTATLAKILDTCSGNRLSYWACGTSTWTARSAPIARAVRSDSWACGKPHDTAITSDAIFFSLRRTASSTAISSNGFRPCLTPSVTTPDLSGLTRIFTA
ncbi:hypothetical protein AGLY_000013 [Aphis glycines]|uniref:Uncharacterized protein n=1 Tax=Aphis glycines TaxID=307491 RepID=A0A6G0U862_APHGL|nr:hypothetical protein AGLY_000013 [Aphis glycines]